MRLEVLCNYPTSDLAMSRRLGPNWHPLPFPAPCPAPAWVPEPQRPPESHRCISFACFSIYMFTAHHAFCRTAPPHPAQPPQIADSPKTPASCAQWRGTTAMAGKAFNKASETWRPHATQRPSTQSAPNVPPPVKLPRLLATELLPPPSLHGWRHPRCALPLAAATPSRCPAARSASANTCKQQW